jgi:putative ABC transport system permease protein
VAATAAVVEYGEITEENVGSFHFHGDPSEFPLTAVIVLPNDQKSATILKARYNASRTSQMLTPLEVVEELMGIVFRVKRFFDANFAVIALSTILFFILVVMLSLRIRARERDTMHKIGASRLIIFYLQACELVIVFAISLALAGVLSGVMLLLAPRLLRIV